jgi:hypothetical protein
MLRRGADKQNPKKTFSGYRECPPERSGIHEAHEGFVPFLPPKSYGGRVVSLVDERLAQKSGRPCHRAA